eukprot:2593941-Amphidinium_carterae.1
MQSSAKKLQRRIHPAKLKKSKPRLGLVTSWCVSGRARFRTHSDSVHFNDSLARLSRAKPSKCGGYLTPTGIAQRASSNCMSHCLRLKF